jgi:phosphoenolpyruvate carboxykinase (GTP)
MAMLPFCGYNAADYFSHWLSVGAKAGSKAPKIFGVNWFRKNAEGKYAWPGFGENARVLKWIIGRVEGKASGVETPIGVMPSFNDIDWSGVDFSPHQFENLTSLDSEKWQNEITSSSEFFAKFGTKIPPVFSKIQESILSRFSKSTSQAKKGSTLLSL